MITLRKITILSLLLVSTSLVLGHDHEEPEGPYDPEMNFLNDQVSSFLVLFGTTLGL